MTKVGEIAAVIVIYNKAIKNSETFQSLLSDLDIPILVYDNSTKRQESGSLNNVEYQYDSSNSGVSKAYNYAIAWAKKKNCSHLLLLDSDSEFPKDAILEYEKTILEYPEKIVLPAMISNGHKISPFYFKSGKSQYGDDIKFGDLELGKIVAINSGMLIPLKQIDGGFNENLPLDWSDIDFIRILENVKAIHIPLEVHHGLSEHEDRNISSAKYRYITYLKGIKLVALNFRERLLMLFWAKLKALKLCLKYKTLWFIFHFTRNFYA